MSEEREPIIDALLEELLGGVQPPDLTQRILDAYDESTDSSIDVRIGKATSTQGPSVDAAPTPRPQTRRVAPARRKKSHWQTWVSAAIVLIAAAGFAYWAITFNTLFDQTNPPIVTENHPRDPSTIEVVDIPDPTDENQNQAEWTNPDASSDSNEPNTTPPVGTIADDSEKPAFESGPVKFRRNIKMQEPASDQRIVAFVNTRLKEKWDAGEAGDRKKPFTATPAVSDKVWFRRASRFLIGRVLPLNAEQNWLKQSADREDAVERLMGTNAFRERWASFLTTVLIGDDEGDSNTVDVQELQAYLAKSIDEDKPYDQLAFELITAAGSNKPGEEDFNPATNFLLANQQIEWIADNPKDAHRVGATEKVGQVFLGKQLQCARCHNHEQLTQVQYYEMMSFFAQMRPVNAKEKGSLSRITNVDVVSETGEENGEGDLYYVDAEGHGTTAFPRYLNGGELNTKSGRIREINRRKELADMIVASDDFSAAFVNRLWDEALGAGFTRPIDNMGSHNPPSHPELLENLATEFRNSQFDMKSVMKWIVMSRAFDRRSRAMTDHLVGRPDAFSSFARQDPTLLYPSVGWTLAQLAKAAVAEGQFDPRTTLGNLGGGVKKQTSSPAQKARELAHVNAKTQFIKDAYGDLIRRLARNEKMTDRHRVVHMFLATVGRIPTAYERKHGMNILKHSSTVDSGLQDVGVVLLNSKEFITQH